MRVALNGATTMKADLETDIRVADSAGFDCLEIWAPKLRRFLEDHSISALKVLFEECSQTPLSINSIEHITFRNAENYAKIKLECDELSEIAAAINCPYIVVVPGRLPQQNIDREEVICESVTVLEELCSISSRHGVKLAFEFLGQSDCSVPTLDLANEIVCRAESDNLGLVIDSFHFYAGGSTTDMIRRVKPESIYVFHINDAEDKPAAELNDSHRLLPGLGILPLAEIVRSFRTIGYDDVASVEIFRPAYWSMDPFQLGRESLKATKAVLQSA